ncbi:Permease of the drug/metabolite transporter (DMT) superfamily [Loktanella atrilutea]|uniref:Permease of the drug/metabolite transporter (DMT) superfamily n=1 Tax=Loktanella atrilutea TaxID=366533 RepID=A0A1M4YWW9_LOKAT|nr:DMT family transporter [Loktanella atrilutea]SHF10012.1 Permease of the drug/metabolite transporter (DMT) superfamily [Loktanella atrilutea]
MQPLRGISYKIVSVMVFVAMSSLVKAVSENVPPGQAVFFRSAFALPVIVAWLAMRHELRNGWKTAHPMGHVWRGLVGTSAMGLGFAGLGLLPLPEVTAIGYAAPLLVVIFAAMFLNEEVRAFRLSAVALGLAGVLIVLSPRLSLGAQVDHAQTLGAVLVLMGAVCAALAQVFVRKLVFTEDTAAIVFWFSVTATVLSLLTLPWGWAWPTPAQWVMLIMAGLLGGIGQIFLTSSYRFADASLVAPFDYTSMILALIVGYAIFDEVPTLTMMIGAAIVISAGVMIILRERHLGLKRARQRKVTGTVGHN